MTWRALKSLYITVSLANELDLMIPRHFLLTELDGMAVVGGVVGESVTGEDEGVLVGWCVREV